MPAPGKAIARHNARPLRAGRPREAHAPRDPVLSSEQVHRAHAAPECAPLDGPARERRDPRYEPPDETAARRPCPVPSWHDAARRSGTSAAMQTASHVLGDGLENDPDRCGKPLPIVDFVFQATAAGRGEAIVLRLPSVLRLPPFGRDQALVLEPVKRRIE